MKVTQVYEITNAIVSQELGLEAVVAEDLSNVVEVGQAIQNANALDNYVKALFDHIGRVVFVDRAYSGRVPSVVRRYSGKNFHETS